MRYRMNDGKVFNTELLKGDDIEPWVKNKRYCIETDSYYFEERLYYTEKKRWALIIIDKEAPANGKWLTDEEALEWFFKSRKDIPEQLLYIIKEIEE